MPRYEITSPDGKRFEVTAPDGASQEEVLAYAQSQFKSPEKPYNPTDDMSAMERGVAGFGKAFVDMGRGVKQRLGMVTPEEVDAQRKVDAPLMQTGAGNVGNIAGNVAALIPALAVPGASTVAGAGVVGALSGAMQPTGTGESALQNTAMGAVMGTGAQYGLGKAATFMGNRLASKTASEGTRQAQNAVTDDAIREAQALGYKTVPSISNGSMLGKVIEGATGKEKAKQLAAVKNQPVTDALARKAFGLPDDAPLSRETMKQVRADAAAKGYEPVRQLPQIETDAAWESSISKLTSRSDNAAKDFGELVKTDIQPLADGLKQVKSFSGDTAVDAIAVLREKASDLYAQGNKTLGKAHRQAAEAIEAQIERGLAKQGKDGAALIKDFRDARMRMAQSFDLEKAIREGEGSVDLRALGKMFAKNPERMSGELRQMGRIGAAMPEVTAIPKDGWANPITAWDSGFGTMGGIIAGNPLPLALPLGRVAGRYGLMSDAGQKMLTKPKYGPGMLDKMAPKTLEELRRLGAGGLLGYSAQ